MRILFFFSSLLIIASCSQSNYAKYGPIYEKEELSLLPDYSNLIYWAAHPNKKTPPIVFQMEWATIQLLQKNRWMCFLYIQQVI